MHDRLLFFTIQNRIEFLPRLPRQINSTYPSSQLARSEQNPLRNNIWEYQMSITDEITQLLNSNDKHKK
jgi:hypothetical protein